MELIQPEEIKKQPEEIKKQPEIKKETFKESDLITDVREKSKKDIEKTLKTLNNEFSYNLKVSESDNVKLNDSDVNNELATTHNIRVVVDSKKAKEELKKVVGVDFNKMISTANKETPDISILMKKRLSGIMRKLTKDIL